MKKLNPRLVWVTLLSLSFSGCLNLAGDPWSIQERAFVPFKGTSKIALQEADKLNEKDRREAIDYLMRVLQEDDAQLDARLTALWSKAAKILKLDYELPKLNNYQRSHARSSAALFLQRWTGDPYLKKAIPVLLNHTDDNRRGLVNEVLQALGCPLDEHFVPLLSAIGKKGKLERARGETFYLCPSEKFAEFLAVKLSSSDEVERRGALLLVSGNSEVKSPALSEALFKNVPKVAGEERSTHLKALKVRKSVKEEWVPTLFEWVNKDDEERARAALALLYYSNAKQLPPWPSLMQLLDVRPEDVLCLIRKTGTGAQLLKAFDSIGDDVHLHLRHPSELTDATCDANFY